MRLVILSFLFSFLSAFSAKSQTVASFISDTVCTGATSQLTSTSTSTANITAVNWDVNGDGDFSDATGNSIAVELTSLMAMNVGIQVISDIPDTSVVYRAVVLRSLPNADFAVVNGCEGSNVNFNNLSSDPEGDSLSYVWDFNDGDVSIEESPVHIYSTANNYSVKLVTSDNFCSDTVQKPLQIFAAPQAEIVVSGDSVLCDNGNVTLTAITTGTFFWSTGQSSNSITVIDSGLYYILVNNTNGCANRDSIILSQEASPQLSVTSDTSLVAGETISLSASGANSYVWSPSETVSSTTLSEVVINPTETTTYSVTGTSALGCETTATINVLVYDNYFIDYTNLITPNNDNVNDAFTIRNLPFFTGCPLTVFNQVGNIVYESADYKNDWEGTRNGEVLPNDTYYFTIQCDSEESSFSGTITLLR